MAWLFLSMMMCSYIIFIVLFLQHPPYNHVSIIYGHNVAYHLMRSWQSYKNIHNQHGSVKVHVYVATSWSQDPTAIATQCHAVAVGHSHGDEY